ncbi:MAG: hypothetical protein DCF29_07575 [Alphaproteobacteria bacterium]|nr:MAG: hypothetical protein DCF29_07575 [Alphaproteobacteria bacterium]
MKASAIIALALSALATPALADPFDGFRAFCLETSGEFAVAMAAANEAGWSADPRIADPDRKVLINPETVDNPLPELFMAGEAALDDGRSYPSCAVAGPADWNHLIARMNAWAKFEADKANPEEPIWIFTLGPEGPTNQAQLADIDPAELAVAAETLGPIYLVGLRTANVGPFLFFTRIL